MNEMTAALIVKDNKILLVHNTKHNQIRIEPPGGKKENNESFEECIKREVEEELGIRIKVNDLFQVCKTTSPEGEFEVHMFLSEILQGEPKIMEPNKISKFGWYSSEELNDLMKKRVLVPNLHNSIDKIKQLLVK